jgi:digeranylgeranylglycerophospholipid reductase
MMVSAHKFDVLIVGGGPAGLSAASEAAKGGLNVAVIEKDRSIAGFIRTSGVTWVKEMEELGLPRNMCNPIKRYGIYSPTKEYVIETPRAEACVLDVRKLYQYLAHQAAVSGAEIFLGTRVNSASYNKDKTAIEMTADSSTGMMNFVGSIAIDASGFSTIVGRNLGLVSRWEKFGVGAEYEAYAEKVETDTWALMVGQNYSPAGYCWVFPVGENRVRVGVGVGRPESSVDPFDRLRLLIEKRPGLPLKKLGRVCPLEFHYGIVPNQGPRSLTVGDRVLLAGDSAGHLNPVVLEGIRFAIKFGRMAGEIAKKSIMEDDANKIALAEYEKRWKKEIWSNFKIGLSVQKKCLKFSDAQWDKEISILNCLTASEVLELLHSQFPARKFLKRITSHPELLKSVIFSTILQAKMKKPLTYFKKEAR